jgi:hypothetical protein
MLKKHGGLPKGSKLIKLNSYLDQDGLLRVGGRLKFAKINEDQKHQLILPKSHHITRSIIHSKPSCWMSSHNSRLTSEILDHVLSQRGSSNYFQMYEMV